MRIGLGAVQFGLDYGVSNHCGKTPLSEVKNILDAALGRGIDVVDTAAMYGDSETVLGLAMQASDAFRIVTKTPALHEIKGGSAQADELESGCYRSLENLRRSSIYGLLFHRTEDLLGNHGNVLMQRMKFLQSSGYVQKIGVSVYTSEHIDKILERFDIDLIQLPISLLDQRFLRSGHLSRLKEKKIEIHARSIFLQGLVLMSPANLPAFFNPVRTHLESCREICLAAGVSPLTAALAFIQGINEIDVAICGVNNSQQLAEIYMATLANTSIGNWKRFALDNEFFLNPVNWKPQ